VGVSEGSYSHPLTHSLTQYVDEVCVDLYALIYCIYILVGLAFSSFWDR
jgi:hypothetical protein